MSEFEDIARMFRAMFQMLFFMMMLPMIINLLNSIRGIFAAPTAPTTAVTVQNIGEIATAVSQAIQEQAPLYRWSIPREPYWIDGAKVTAPSAETALVSVTVGEEKTGRVFGVHITAGEANEFILYAGTTEVKRFSLGSAGTIHIVLPNPLVDNVQAGTEIKIVNVSPGSEGIVYQASLLYDEG